MNLLRGLLAVSSDDVLAFFNVSGVNNDIVLLMAFLTLILDWFLVTLLVWLAKALKVVVSITRLSLSFSFSFSFSFSLDISCMTVSNNLGVVTDNGRAVVNLLGGFVAMLSHNILAFFDVGCVNNNIIFFMTFLIIVSLTGGVKLDVIGSVTLGLRMVTVSMAVARSSLGNTSE